MGDKERLQTSLSHLRGSATPRPEWARCAGYMEGWEETREGRSSDQLVDVLLAQLSGKTLDEVSTLSGFTGQVSPHHLPHVHIGRKIYLGYIHNVNLPAILQSSHNDTIHQTFQQLTQMYVNS